jgi:hypothetical protein
MLTILAHLSPTPSVWFPRRGALERSVDRPGRRGMLSARLRLTDTELTNLDLSSGVGFNADGALTSGPGHSRFHG